MLQCVAVVFPPSPWFQASPQSTPAALPPSPPAQGAIGDLYNFHLDPSLTLGCGSWGSTSVSSNVGPANLLNIKSVTERRENMLWFRIPPKVYFKVRAWWRPGDVAGSA